MSIRPRFNRAYRVSFLVFLMGCCLSFYLFYLVNAWEKKRLELEFNLRVSDRVRSIQEVIFDHLTLLHSIGDFYAASRHVERDEFSRFTRSVFIHHKDVISLDWMPRVFDADRSVFERLGRQEGIKDFSIKELLPDGTLAPAAHRPEYFPVFYIESQKNNALFFGLDAAFDPLKREAMQRACDTNQITSVPVSFLTKQILGSQAYSFQLFLPVYEDMSDIPETVEERRQELAGFVSLLIRVDALIDSAIQGTRLLGLDTYIFDFSVSGHKGPGLVYAHKARLRNEPFLIKYNAAFFGSGLSAQKMVQAAGHNWLIVCKPALTFFSPSIAWQAWIFLIVGLLLSIVLSIYSYEILSRAGRVEKVVLDRTSELTSANENLAKEVQARKNAESALRQLVRSHDLILESAGEGIFGLDLEGRHTFVNPAAAKMLGYDIQELIGQPSHMIWHHTHKNGMPYPEEDCPIYMAYKDGVIHRGSDEIFWRKDGTSFAVEYISRPIREGDKLVGAVVSFMDIAERKHFEEELLRSNKELEQFAYATSHDLQEPLRMIGSYVDLLSRRYKGKLDTEADEFISYVTEGVDRMHLLISDLLEYAHVAVRRKTLAMIDLNQAFESAKKNLKFSIEESHAVITSVLLPSVLADFHQMVMLFQNLLSNAIKQVPQIDVLVNKNQRSEWEFSVRDNGIGFEAQYSERIFGIFQRLYTHREYAGTGIGLALCKKILDNHGGRIWARSKPEKGTVFYFTMPIS